jgi:hypothetical protein
MPTTTQYLKQATTTQEGTVAPQSIELALADPSPRLGSGEANLVSPIPMFSAPVSTMVATVGAPSATSVANLDPSSLVDCPVLSPSTLAGPLASPPPLLSPTNGVVSLQGSLCPPVVAAAANGASTVAVHVHDLHSKPLARPLASHSTWQQPPLTAPTPVLLAAHALEATPVLRLSAVRLPIIRGVDAPVSSSNSSSSSGSRSDGSSGRSPPVSPLLSAASLWVKSVEVPSVSQRAPWVLAVPLRASLVCTLSTRILRQARLLP